VGRHPPFLIYTLKNENIG
jgi:hypothetical protein